MAQQTKRIRRATLRGWWRNLPFLLLPMGVFMSFAYLETARLQNQYKQSDVTRYIQQLTKEIENLRANNRELTRIEVMDQQSASWQLREPDPNQMIPLSPIAVETAYAKVNAFSNQYYVAELPTRTVMLHVDYENAMAQMNENELFAGGIVPGDMAHGQEESN